RRTSSESSLSTLSRMASVSRYCNPSRSADARFAVLLPPRFRNPVAGIVCDDGLDGARHDECDDADLEDRQGRSGGSVFDAHCNSGTCVTSIAAVIARPSYVTRASRVRREGAM